jgi:ribosomal-protein-alanine N-acetyltransferase
MQHEIPRIDLLTDRLRLRTLGPDHALEVAHYLRMNRNHFQASGPKLTDEFYTPAYQEQHLKLAEQNRRKGLGQRIFLLDRETGELVGDIGLSNVFWGGFRSGVIGYKIAQHHQGRGLIREALTAFLTWAFHTLDLQRLEANIRPDNQASLKVASHLGFHCEGMSPAYLEIDGERKDHLRMTLLRQNWLNPSTDWPSQGFGPVLPKWSPRVHLRTFLQANVMVAEAWGTYRVGEMGNEDGEYLFIETAAALFRSQAKGLIWDFRRLSYTWSDSFLRLLAINEVLFPEQAFPVSVLYGPSSGSGIAQLIGAKPQEWPEGYFDQPSQALQWIHSAIESRAHSFSE